MEEHERKPLWAALTKCPRCNKEMSRATTKLNGVRVREWVCFGCNETLMHPEDYKKAEEAGKRTMIK